MGNIIAIVGRPNVGKSTLFNRLTESRDAIVESVSGVTRDRHYGKGEWTGNEFSVIDTGGYVSGSDDIFEDEINKQVELAIEEADMVIFTVDVTTGVTDLDEAFANVLRRTKKPVAVAVNMSFRFQKYISLAARGGLRHSFQDIFGSLRLPFSDFCDSTGRV